MKLFWKESEVGIMKGKTFLLGLFVIAVVWLLYDLIYSSFQKKFHWKRGKVLLGVIAVMALLIGADYFYNSYVTSKYNDSYQEAYQNLFMTEREKVQKLGDALNLALETPGEEQIAGVVQAMESVDQVCKQSLDELSGLPQMELLGTEDLYYGVFFPAIERAARQENVGKLQELSEALNQILPLYEDYTNPEDTYDKKREMQLFYSKLANYRDTLEKLSE